MSILTWEAVAEPTERFPSCHCSVLVETAEGELLVGYYAGEGEAKPNAAWVLTRRGEAGFGSLEIVADTDGKPEGNGILLETASGEIQLVYGTMHGKLDGEPGLGVRWVTCDLRRKRSSDGGQSWSSVEMLDSEWGHVPRCKPVRLSNGDLLFGTEYNDGHSRIWRSQNDASTWEMIATVDGERNQHPTLLERTDGSILALLRPSGRQGCVLQSESVDGGETWSEAVTTELPSPFAALDAVRLADGRFLVVWNSNPRERNPLTIAMSEDEGRTWPIRKDLVRGEGRFHYPAVIQTSDGAVHVTFTNNRVTIDHVAMLVDWVSSEEESLQWDESGRRL
jgi:predicted neuraminidase